MTRDNAPDLLASMFGEAPEEARPESRQQEARPESRQQEPERQQQPAASRRPAVAGPPSVARPVEARPEPVPEPPPAAEPPIRCTHYLSRETAGRLPIAQGHLLMMTALQKRDVSNSAVVEAALRLAFADLEAHGEESRLVRILQEMARDGGEG